MTRWILKAASAILFLSPASTGMAATIQSTEKEIQHIALSGGTYMANKAILADRIADTGLPTGEIKLGLAEATIIATSGLCLTHKAILAANGIKQGLAETTIIAGDGLSLTPKAIPAAILFDRIADAGPLDPNIRIKSGIRFEASGDGFALAI